MSLIHFFKQSRNLFLNKTEAFFEIKKKVSVGSTLITYLIIYALFALIGIYFSYKHQEGNYWFLKNFIYAVIGYSVYLFLQSVFLKFYSTMLGGKMFFSNAFKFVLSINLLQTCYLMLLVPMYIYGGANTIIFFLAIFIICIKPWLLALNLIVFRHLNKFEGGTSYFVNLFTFVTLLVLIGIGIYFFVDYSILIQIIEVIKNK